MRDATDVLRQALIPLLSVVGAVGALLAAIFWLRSWWRENAGPAASEQEMLSQYLNLNRQGQLTDDEYRSIKGRITSRLGPTARPAAERPRPEAEKQDVQEPDKDSG